MCMRDSLETIPEYENFRAFQHVSGVSRRFSFSLVKSSRIFSLRKLFFYGH